MVRELLDDENQAESEPPLDAVEDGDAVPEYIQYRGRHTSVTVDDFNLIFVTEERNGRKAHKPLPVATEDDVRAGDAPQNAVVLPVAVELVRTTSLFGFGVACEEPGCGEVFATPKALDGHQSSHKNDDAETDTNEGEQ
jgi:hypothetical protein